MCISIFLLTGLQPEHGKLTITCNFFFYVPFLPWKIYIHVSVMLNCGGILRIILIFFWLKCVLKGLWTCVQKFGEINWPVSDLWTSRQIDATRAKVCMSDPCLIGLISFPDNTTTTLWLLQQNEWMRHHYQQFSYKKTETPPAKLH